MSTVHSNSNSNSNSSTRAQCHCHFPCHTIPYYTIPIGRMWMLVGMVVPSPAPVGCCCGMEYGVVWYRYGMDGHPYPHPRPVPPQETSPDRNEGKTKANRRWKWIPWHSLTLHASCMLRVWLATGAARSQCCIFVYL